MKEKKSSRQSSWREYAWTALSDLRRYGGFSDCINRTHTKIIIETQLRVSLGRMGMIKPVTQWHSDERYKIT